MTLARFLRVCTAQLALVVGPALAFAGSDRDTVQIDSVVAVEDAQCMHGRYRVVFTTRAALPSATDGAISPLFLLGDQPLTFPPCADPTQRTHFAYFDELPAGATFLRAVRPPSPDDAEPRELSRVRVDPPALLKRSRPVAGEYEAAHIRRSADVASLFAEWQAANLVFVGTFMLNDIDPADKNVRIRAFEVEKVIRGAGVAAGQSIDFASSASYEIGARYVVFARINGAGVVDRARQVSVRVWWPADDDVLRFLREYPPLETRLRRDAALAPAVRDFLVGQLRCPTAEVRRSAALELSRLAHGAAKLSPDQVRVLDECIAREPSPTVKEALTTVRSAARR